jgi:hypothetical protein
MAFSVAEVLVIFHKKVEKSKSMKKSVDNIRFR